MNMSHSDGPVWRTAQHDCHPHTRNHAGGLSCSSRAFPMIGRPRPGGTCRQGSSHLTTRIAARPSMAKPSWVAASCQTQSNLQRRTRKRIKTFKLYFHTSPHFGFNAAFKLKIMSGNDIRAATNIAPDGTTEATRGCCTGDYSLPLMERQCGAIVLSKRFGLRPCLGYANYYECL
jgi:hypothetical protein